MRLHAQRNVQYYSCCAEPYPDITYTIQVCCSLPLFHYFIQVAGELTLHHRDFYVRCLCNREVTIANWVWSSGHKIGYNLTSLDSQILTPNGVFGIVTKMWLLEHTLTTARLVYELSYIFVLTGGFHGSACLFKFGRWKYRSGNAFRCNSYSCLQTAFISASWTIGSTNEIVHCADASQATVLRFQYDFTMSADHAGSTARLLHPKWLRWEGLDGHHYAALNDRLSDACHWEYAADVWRPSACRSVGP